MGERDDPDLRARGHGGAADQGAALRAGFCRRRARGDPEAETSRERLSAIVAQLSENGITVRIDSDGDSRAASAAVEEARRIVDEAVGIDDPVRMYLREIGKVPLLTAQDEKRLARAMEERDHLIKVIARLYSDEEVEDAQIVHVVKAVVQILRDEHDSGATSTATALLGFRRQRQNRGAYGETAAEILRRFRSDPTAYGEVFVGLLREFQKMRRSTRPSAATWSCLASPSPSASPAT